MLSYDLLTEMQTETHSAGLCRLIGLEHATRYLWIHSRTIVFNQYGDLVAASGNAYDYAPTPVRPLCGRLDRIDDEIV